MISTTLDKQVHTHWKSLIECETNGSKRKTKYAPCDGWTSQNYLQTNWDWMCCIRLALVFQATNDFPNLLVDSCERDSFLNAVGRPKSFSKARQETTLINLRVATRVQWIFEELNGIDCVWKRKRKFKVLQKKKKNNNDRDRETHTQLWSASIVIQWWLQNALNFHRNSYFTQPTIHQHIQSADAIEHKGCIIKWTIDSVGIQKEQRQINWKLWFYHNFKVKSHFN